jgi:1-phosphofructokinase/tagatose 6-phosphate kinase
MQEKGVLAVGLNPVMQKTIVLDHLWENEVNRSSNYMLSVAGKGANTARVLTELGADTIHISHAGGLFRQTFLDMLAEDGIHTKIAESGSEIRLCYTLINSERHTVTEIVEEALGVTEGTDATIRSLFLEALDSVDTVTVSGTKASGYSEDIIPWMVKEARLCNKIVVLDVKGNDLINSLPYNPTVIKPNLKEFSETLFPDFTFKEHSTEATVLDSVKKKMMELEQEYGVTTVLTQGAKSVFVTNNGAVMEKSVDSVTPVNTIGCGDAFTAGLAYGLHREFPIERCVEIGIACGKANALNLKPGSIAGQHLPQY